MKTTKRIRAAPVKGSLYQHQQKAFEFCCRLFGLIGGDDDKDRQVRDLPEEVSKIPVAGSPT